MLSSLSKDIIGKDIISKDIISKDIILIVCYLYLVEISLMTDIVINIL